MRRIVLGLLAGLTLGCGPLPWEQPAPRKNSRVRPFPPIRQSGEPDDVPAPDWAAGLAVNVRAEMEELQGIWVVTRARRHGDVEQALTDATVALNGDRFTSRIDGGVAAKGTWTVDPNQTPKTIDLHYTAGPDKGQDDKGIYHREGTVWVVFFGGAGKPRPASFEAKAEPDQTFLTMKRANP